MFFFNSLFSFRSVLRYLLPCFSFVLPLFANNTHKIATPLWLTTPFILLLLMIATGPLLYAHFWHKHYPKVAIILGLFVASYYIFVLHAWTPPIEALAEYIQFIVLIAALYIISGGILLHVNTVATPRVNIILLLIGALLSNFIGTTGASMLLIKPYIRLNKKHIKPYHIVFFIFMVSNVGGALTPIGDPPLFLGFLKGVPFFWTLTHNFLPWLFTLSALALVFYFFDKKNKAKHAAIAQSSTSSSTSIVIKGKSNFIFLLIVIVAVFLDPNIFSQIPAIHYHGHHFSFLRECILLFTAFLAYFYAQPEVLKENQFSFEPIKEVVFIFIGIFFTMIPALALVSTFAQSDAGKSLINFHTLYWGTGMLSAVLDNAPTYLNCLAASMATDGSSIHDMVAVKNYARGIFPHAIPNLEAISLAAVFFGAMTYIGNGPNFMVKAIAEQSGVGMPSFFGYIFRYSLVVLLPILFLVWLLFFCV